MNHKTPIDIKATIVFLFIAVVIISGCIGSNPSHNTPPLQEQTCMKILDETLNDDNIVSSSTVTVKNNCDYNIEGVVIYTAYESGGIKYRGFVPEFIVGFILQPGEEKTKTAAIPRNWYTETKEIAYNRYNHGVVESYDVRIRIDKIGVDMQRSIESRYSKQNTTVKEVQPIYNPFVLRGRW